MINYEYSKSKLDCVNTYIVREIMVDYDNLDSVHALFEDLNIDFKKDIFDVFSKHYEDEKIPTLIKNSFNIVYDEGYYGGYSYYIDCVEDDYIGLLKYYSDTITGNELTPEILEKFHNILDKYDIYLGCLGKYLESDILVAYGSEYDGYTGATIDFNNKDYFNEKLDVNKIESDFHIIYGDIFDGKYVARSDVRTL